MKIGHIALSVSNIDRSVAFYRKYFGLRCIKKYAHTDNGLVIALLKQGGICLELFGFKKHRLLPEYRKTLSNDLRVLGVKHFSLETKHIDDIYRKFKKAHIDFETDLHVFDNGKRYFFIKDPDGILIEIMEGG